MPDLQMRSKHAEWTGKNPCSSPPPAAEWSLEQLFVHRHSLSSSHSCRRERVPQFMDVNVPLLPRRDAIKRRLASALRSLYVLVAPASNQFFETSHYG
jgi:hypothetical protein